MAGAEQRKQDYAREYIKENVLNKELVGIQDSLNELKSSVTLWLLDDKNWDKKDDNNVVVDNIMNLLFNDKWKQRWNISFEWNKLKSISYHLISDDWKKNLDFLYNELKKAKSLDELKQSTWAELNNLRQEVVSGYEVRENNIENLKVDEQYIYRQCKLYWLTDDRQIAYTLATVKWECGFKNIKEIWWENKKYGKEWYYGRWFLQLTHKSNYEKYTKIIKESGLSFKDNKWNILSSEKLDLVKNPDTVLESNDLAVFILVDWMKNWWPYRQKSKMISNYVNNEKVDYYNARKIINWMDHADRFKWYAEDYLNKINFGTMNWNIDILNNTEILAKSRNELWWMWNSIMYWIQWLGWKSEFTNMNWIEWKNTTNHPDRFNSQEDVRNYAKNHPWVKSFLLYFGGNTSNNKKTLSDIEKWSKWLKNEWIQPVLSTCIWVDSHVTSSWEKWLIPLNNDIKNLWNTLNCPVIDFAKLDNKIPKSWDNIHPTWTGYQKMREEIDRNLA